MRRILQASLLTSAVAAVALASGALPASAQMDQMGQSDQAYGSISFDSFQDQLAPYGWWLYSDRWGVVWQPYEASGDFRPYYTGGHWVYTDDYGWYWQSGLPWGDIAFHYGRWVNDPDDGWLWIPGYVWSPGWVAWRSNGQYIGWMPMPPDEAFLGGRGDIGFGASFRFGLGDVGGLYGYSRWYGAAYDETRFAQNWVFVGAGLITAPDYRVVAIRDPGRVINIIHQTRNITNYTIVNNYVVNRSVDVRVVERAAGHPIAVVRAASVIRHPNLVATVAVGQRVQVRMRAVAPRGTGIANSAPPPPPHVVAKLSTNVTPRNGHAPVHLFTKATVSAPEAQAKFRGPAARSPSAEGPSGAMGPGADRSREAQPGMAGPNGERPREGEPGMTGRNPRETQPGMERQRETPPGAGPNGEMAPGAERPRETQPGMERQRETPPGAGPSGEAAPGAERSRETQPGMERQRETPPGAGPNGESAPAAERPRETQPGMERQREAPPGAGPNGETAPGAERPRETQPGMERQRETPPGAGPNGEMGPNAERPRASQPRTERQHEAPPNAGPNGGEMGPNAEHPRETQPGMERQRQSPPGAEAPPTRERAPAQPGQQNPQNPPKKKVPPPQNPPQ